MALPRLKLAKRQYWVMLQKRFADIPEGAGSNPPRRLAGSFLCPKSMAYLRGQVGSAHQVRRKPETTPVAQRAREVRNADIDASYQVECGDEHCGVSKRLKVCASHRQAPAGTQCLKGYNAHLRRFCR